ncbi:MAG: protein kinase [Anaerolineae bacterium]|nr:protein kinase [Anaerolineae bacterium]
MTGLTGQVLGNYRIIERIGLGGMATVYKAYQASMDRYVAIKVLPRQLADDPSFIGRFEHEAQTIARLEHKHILPVYDFGEYDGYTYLVMRYVESGNLKDLTKQGPLPLPDVVTYLSQIADALQYAHDRGVIHRDVKTSNILIGEGKQTYLMDFGIAKLAVGSTQFTGTGALLGTPAYMSPEQCSGMPVDTRSDIYSLGVVLYEMLTGAVPFEAETPVAVVLKHIQDPLPSPRLLNPSIPESVERVLLHAMAKEPESRFQSAKEMADALQNAFEALKVQHTSEIPLADVAREARPGTRRHRSGGMIAGIMLLSAALLIVAGLAGVLFAQNWDAGSAAAPGGTSPDSAAAGVAQATPQPEYNPGWTVFTSTRGGQQCDRQLVATGDGLWMAGSGGLVFWTPDGKPTKYTSAALLPFHNFVTMTVDSAGMLWLGGGEGHPGVIRLAAGPDGTLRASEYFDSANSQMQSDEVWTLLAGSNGTVLAGTSGTYLEWWDGERWQAPDIPTYGTELEGIGDRVYSLLRTTDRALWAGGPQGLARWDGSEWRLVPLPEDLMVPGQEEYNVLDLYEDTVEGVIWVHVYAYPSERHHTLRLALPGEDGAGWQWLPPEYWMPEPLNSILRMPDGTLWLVGSNIVVQVDGTTNERTVYDYEQGISGYTYLDIVQAADETIWLTTDEALVQYRRGRWTAFHVDNELPEDDLVAVDEAADGALWFATNSGGVITYADDVWTFVTYLDAEVFDMKLQGNTAWFATAGGLFRWEDGAVRRFSPETDDISSDVVVSLALDPRDPAILWVGTINGLNALDTTDYTWRTWTHEDDRFPGPIVRTLYFDDAGDLWIGTGYDEETTGPGEAALVRFQNGDWTLVGTVEPTSEEWEGTAETILSIAADGHGGLWVGSSIWLYHWDGADWRQYTAAEGAPEYVPVQTILVEGDSVWIATGWMGLYRLAPDGWHQWVRDGLGTPYLTDLLRATDGTLWITSHEGAIRLVGDPLEFE